MPVPTSQDRLGAQFLSFLGSPASRAAQEVLLGWARNGMKLEDDQGGAALTK